MILLTWATTHPLHVMQVWLHNQLSVLVKALDHELALPPEWRRWDQNRLSQEIGTQLLCCFNMIMFGG